MVTWLDLGFALKGLLTGTLQLWACSSCYLDDLHWFLRVLGLSSVAGLGLWLECFDVVIIG